MKNLYQWALTLFAVILLLPLNSCSGGSGRSKVEYIPFRETKDGQWGMISPDGKVLFREEFDNEPTFAREGRFFVRNDKGLWEMYSTEAKPKKIGGEYTSASSFNNGRAVVAEADEPVKIIDTDGKTIKKLDKINNKVVENVSPLYGGLATFETADSLLGAIDKEGNCIIEPNYIALQRGNGFFLAVPAKYRKAFRENEGLKGVKVSVLDADGKEICQLSGDKYKNIRAVNDKIVASQERDGKTVWSILDTKGNQLFKGGAKVDNILDVEGENFTYRNGEHVGLMNIKVRHSSVPNIPTLLSMKMAYSSPQPEKVARDTNAKSSIPKTNRWAVIPIPTSISLEPSTGNTPSRNKMTMTTYSSTAKARYSPNCLIWWRSDCPMATSR